MAEGERAVFDGDGFSGSEDGCFDVCGAVVVDLVVFPDSLRDEFVEAGEYVAGEVWVPVFVDDDGSGGVFDKDVAEPGKTGGRGLLNRFGDIDKFLFCGSLDGNGLHTGGIGGYFYKTRGTSMGYA